MKKCAAKRVWRLVRQGNLKRHDGSEVNAMAAKTSVKASLPVFTTSGTHPCLCVPQAILEETPVLHIRHHNNQRHVLFQRYVCKRVYTLRARGEQFA